MIEITSDGNSSQKAANETGRFLLPFAKWAIFCRFFCKLLSNYPRSYYLPLVLLAQFPWRKQNKTNTPTREIHCSWKHITAQLFHLLLMGIRSKALPQGLVICPQHNFGGAFLGSLHSRTRSSSTSTGIIYFKRPHYHFNLQLGETLSGYLQAAVALPRVMIMSWLLSVLPTIISTSNRLLI